MDKLQAEIMETMGTMMKGSYKIMFYSVFLFFPAFYIIGGVDPFLGIFKAIDFIGIGGLYADAIIKLPIPLPWFAAFDLFNPASWTNIALYNETNWFGWYFVCYLFISFIVLNPLLNLYEKYKGRKNNAE